MKKKILIGSIGAVAIIVLASLTSAVGFNLARSSVEKVSPLFNLRTKLAINNENEGLTTAEYVGEGKNILLIPEIKSIFKTREKYYTDYPGAETCRATCGTLTCGIFCVLLLIILTLFLGCFETGSSDQLLELNQKINGNSHLKQLITSHPDLLPEIMALNS